MVVVVFALLWFVEMQRYDSLYANYTSLINQYSSLQQQYSALQNQYNSLQNQYLKLNENYMNLQNMYNSLLNDYVSCIEKIGPSSPTSTLQVEAIGLSGISTGIATLTLLINNPPGNSVSINGFTLGSLSCVFTTPLIVPAGAQGFTVQIRIPVVNGYFAPTGVNVNGITATCSGNQAANVGIQYSGYITAVNGQTYPFTVTAFS